MRAAREKTVRRIAADRAVGGFDLENFVFAVVVAANHTRGANAGIVAAPDKISLFHINDALGAVQRVDQRARRHAPREIPDHVRGDAQQPGDFGDLEAARGDKLGVGRRHRRRLPFQALLQHQHLAGVLQPAFPVLPVLRHPRRGVGGQLLVGRQDAVDAGALSHPLRLLALDGDRQADRLLGQHDARDAEQSVHREAANVEDVLGRDQERLARKFGHHVQPERRDPVEKVAVGGFPQRDPVGGDGNQGDDRAAGVAFLDRVGVAAHHQPELHHLGEFEIVLPVVGGVEQREKFVVGRRQAGAVLVLAIEGRRELGEVLAQHGDAGEKGSGVERGGRADVDAGDRMGVERRAPAIVRAGLRRGFGAAEQAGEEAHVQPNTSRPRSAV